MDSFNQPVRPNNHLALAIITTVLCCLPAGIVSIVYATQVNSKYNIGDYEGAERASKNAKTWWIASIIGTILFWIGCFGVIWFFIGTDETFIEEFRRGYEDALNQ